MRRLGIAIALLLLSFSLQAKVQMVFSLEPSDDYFAIPYPNDLHRHPDGKVDRRNFPVPEANPMSTHYRKVSDRADGFALTEAAFIRFNGALDKSRLPDVEKSMAPDSSVFLVNIDPGSPEYGKRVPVYSYFHDHKSGALKNLLAVSPYPGFVLREKTAYAVIVLRGLDPSLEASPILTSLIAGKTPGGKLGESAVIIYRPLADFLKDQGIAPEDIAAATVYTTGEPTAGLKKIIDFVHALAPPPLDGPLKPYRDHQLYYAFQSSYTAPQFQTGRGSQLARGGKIFYDRQGKPIVQRQEKVPIVVVVPKGKMPARGFPLVIYLHGGADTTDEYLDHYITSRNGQFTIGEGPARTFAAQGIAGVTMAIVKNPERYRGITSKGRLAELPFYNFFRPDVMVANHWQACADASLILEIMKKLAVDPKLCPGTDASASPDHKIHYDPSLFFAMGLSMGGTILGAWSGVEPGFIASIPAGASGHWGMLIRNFTQIPAKPYFFSWLTGGRRDEDMDARWPVISLVQAVLEPCDTITYAPMVWKRPLPGAPAKNVYLALGDNDYYTKPVTQEAIATALGLPQAGEVVMPSIRTTQKLMGYGDPLNYPVSLNARSDGGRKVTAAVVQFLPDDRTHEGHWINYNLPEVRHQYGCFLKTLIDKGAATIPAPAPEGSPCE